MSSQIKIVHKVIRLIYIIDMISKGEIKTPSFQRDYIWTKKQRKDLLESIQLEYPIGAILLWKPETKFKIYHEMGPFTINKVSESGFFYILDGFQRLSTLFGCLLNPEKTAYPVDEEKKVAFSIYYDLEKEEFNIPRAKPIEIANLPVYKLIDTFAYLDFSENLRTAFTENEREKANELIERGRKLSSTLIDYEIPIIEIHGGDMEQAVDIFSRINLKGSLVSQDWMVSALTNNEAEEFNLGELIEELLNELEEYGFQGLKREIILQCIQTSFGKIYFDLKIEDLVKRKDFIEKTRKTISSIKKAIQFLYEELLVLERRLLPYNNQLIFLTYFFNEFESASQEQKEQLKKWFWITTYADYFTIYSLSKIRLAFEQFSDFVKGHNINPVYNDKPTLPFSTASFPKKLFFGSVRSTAMVLFLLNKGSDFVKINSRETRGLEINYLFFGNKTLENAIPICYFFETANNFVKPGKHKDFSFLLEERNYELKFEKLFLTKEMINKPKGEVLRLRKEMIIEAEKQFVESLGLDY